MKKNINKSLIPDGATTKRKAIATYTNDRIIKGIADIPEEAKVRIQLFLENMGTIQRGKDNGAKKVQKEFCASDECIRGSKEIIKKLRSVKYEDYSVWGKYMGIHTYAHDQKIVQYILPDLLNDKEFMLELIKDNPEISRYLWICWYNNRDHPLHKMTWRREWMDIKLIEWDIPIVSNLMKDKDFILKTIALVNSDSLTCLYGNIPSDGSLKEDKEIIDAMVAAGEGRHGGPSELILKYLEQKNSALLDDKELMKKIVVQIGWYDRHKHHSKIKDDNEYVSIVYKWGWARSFYSFDDSFKEKNPDYYPDLVKKAETMINNNEQQLIENIQENPLKAAKFKTHTIIDKIDQNLLQDPLFVVKLLFADKDLYSLINHPKKELLQSIANYFHQKSPEWAKSSTDGTIDIDLEHGVISYTLGTVQLGNVCEYGNYVIVWNNGQEQRQHVVYRAARNDDSGDNRWLCFTATKIKSVENNIITVEASSKIERRIYRFSF